MRSEFKSQAGDQNHRGLAKRLTHRTLTPTYIGSNPIPSANIVSPSTNWLSRHPFKVEVTGSNPVGDTKFQVGKCDSRLNVFPTFNFGVYISPSL